MCCLYTNSHTHSHTHTPAASAPIPAWGLPPFLEAAAGPKAHGGGVASIPTCSRSLGLKAPSAVVPGEKLLFCGFARCHSEGLQRVSDWDSARCPWSHGLVSLQAKKFVGLMELTLRGASQGTWGPRWISDLKGTAGSERVSGAPSLCPRISTVSSRLQAPSSRVSKAEGSPVRWSLPPGGRGENNQ